MRLAKPCLGVVAGAILVALLGSTSRADELSAGEAERLARGETVVRPQTLERGQHRYVGGVTYTVLDQPAAEFARLLEDVRVWQRILPQTRSARVVGGGGRDELVELTNGTALVQATYTMHLRRDGRTIRFWLDPARRHDIEDAWGFVKAEPMAHGRALLTYGVLIDLGPGIVRDLFEDGVRKLALSVPERLRSFVAEHDATGERAAR